MTTYAKSEAAREAELLTIAREQLHLESLETRGSDSLDFSDQGVAAIKQALLDAWNAGYRQAIADEETS